jgi:hypothetical protein
MGTLANTQAVLASSDSSSAWTLTLIPQGRLLLQQSTDGAALPSLVLAPLTTAFARGTGHGLLRLGANEVGTPLPAVFSYWRDVGARYVATLCALPELAELTKKPAVRRAQGRRRFSRCAGCFHPSAGSGSEQPGFPEAHLSRLWPAVQSSRFPRRSSPAAPGHDPAPGALAFGEGCRLLDLAHGRIRLRGGRSLHLSAELPRAMSRQLRAWTRAEPMRSSQTCAAFWYGVSGSGVRP